MFKNMRQIENEKEENFKINESFKSEKQSKAKIPPIVMKEKAISSLDFLDKKFKSDFQFP